MRGIYEKDINDKWLYPHMDKVIGKVRIGKRHKQCPECKYIFDNNLPWDAIFCPYCGSKNRG